MPTSLVAGKSHTLNLWDFSTANRPYHGRPQTVTIFTKGKIVRKTIRPTLGSYPRQSGHISHEVPARASNPSGAWSPSSPGPQGQGHHDRSGQHDTSPQANMNVGSADSWNAESGPRAAPPHHGAGGDTTAVDVVRAGWAASEANAKDATPVSTSTDDDKQNETSGAQDTEFQTEVNNDAIAREWETADSNNPSDLNKTGADAAETDKAGHESRSEWSANNSDVRQCDTRGRHRRSKSDGHVSSVASEWDRVQTSREAVPLRASSRRVTFSDPLVIPGKIEDFDASRKSDGFWCVQEQFSLQEVMALRNIESRWERDKWVEISRRFSETTGRTITPEQARAMLDVFYSSC